MSLDDRPFVVKKWLEPCMIRKAKKIIDENLTFHPITKQIPKPILTIDKPLSGQALEIQQRNSQRDVLEQFRLSGGSKPASLLRTSPEGPLSCTAFLNKNTERDPGEKICNKTGKEKKTSTDICSNLKIWNSL
eukprot:gnl/MRDRNA2_/MRDRNA2_86659_c0_seq1.p2 gnl/MRDRNA2_/MRDRNA2_86659_c0~~gnl/MRDRNA2_/MRDRNA2_86659_c0_seq1.p2  ORF type:complete len:133 (+),score=10.59 gnl/MRDRNA2_/MRDRNA2_86659_c0_seq1:766-1164(+)